MSRPRPQAVSAPSAPSRPGSLRYSEPVPRTNSGGLRPDRWVERDERHRSLRALLRRAWLATSTSPRPSRSREIRSTRIRLGAMGGEVPQTSRGAFSLTRHQPSRSQAAWGAMPNWDLAPVVSGFEKAALDPSLWPSVLHDLSVRVGAQGAVLLSTDWRLPGNSVSPRGRGTDRQLLQEWLARG